MMRLDIPTLNAAILVMAPKHVAQAQAPGTFAELMASAPGIVWDGASQDTIFCDARVNHAFRAWHDDCHRAGQFAFDLAGEIATAELQKRQLRARFNSAPQWAQDLIEAEVVAQARFYEAHGFFPPDQGQFTKRLLTKELL